MRLVVHTDNKLQQDVCLLACLLLRYNSQQPASCAPPISSQLPTDSDSVTPTQLRKRQILSYLHFQAPPIFLLHACSTEKLGEPGIFSHVSMT